MKTRLVHFKWNKATMSHEARCPDCGELAAMVTLEWTVMHNRKAPLFAKHRCSYNAITFRDDPELPVPQKSGEQDFA